MQDRDIVTDKPLAWMKKNSQAFDIIFDLTKNQEKKLTDINIKEAMGVIRFEEKSPPNPMTAEEFLKNKLNNLQQQGRHVECDNERNPSILIYNSKEGDPKLNLNGRGRNSSGKQIVCRHLAKEVASRHMKGYSHDLSSVESIQRQPHCKDDDITDTSKILVQLFNAVNEGTTHPLLFPSDPNRQVSAYHNFFHPYSLGIQLKYIASNLACEEECSLLLHYVVPKKTITHVMAISIRHKKNGMYVVKFYDPEMTNMHRRALCKNLEDISELNIFNLWDVSTYIDYKQIKNCLGFSLTSLTKANNHLIVSVDEALKLEALKQFSHELMNKKSLNNEDCLQLLLASITLMPHTYTAKMKEFLMIYILESIKKSSDVGLILSYLSVSQFNILYDAMINNPMIDIKTIGDVISLESHLSVDRQESYYDYNIRPLVETAVDKLTQKNIKNAQFLEQISTLKNAKTICHLKAAIDMISDSFEGRDVLLNELKEVGIIDELAKFGYDFRSKAADTTLQKLKFT